MSKKLILPLIIAFVVFLIAGYFATLGETAVIIHPSMKYGLWAVSLGALSAVSLPMGAAAGLTFNPRPIVTASMTAFGAGALLAALSVELIAPTVMEIVGQGAATGHPATTKSHGIATMFTLICGCIFGGILFVSFDDLINSQGGYIRKMSTLITHLRTKKKLHIEDKINDDQNILDDAHVKQELKAEMKEHSGAAMGIWLGLLIDGIPESFVIGAGFLGLLTGKLAAGGTDPSFTQLVPFTLIAGLFLSNFPEALSSSIGMKKQGISTLKIMFLWFSLVIIVGIGAGIGYAIGAEVPHEVEIGIEGVAAGAMLTMIAQTMIPEAVHIGGNRVVGLSTLIGYLSAVAFKLFE